MFCSVDDSRPAIMGVRFERPKDGPTRLIATDGRCIVFIESKVPDDGGDYDGFTVKASAIAAIPETVSGKEIVSAKDCALTLSVAGMYIRFAFADGVIEIPFPNYHAVLPLADLPVTMIQVNGDYLARFETAVNLFTDGKQSPIVRLHGESEPVEIFADNCPNFYGLLMPLRMDGGTPGNALSRKLKAERDAGK